MNEGSRRDAPVIAIVDDEEDIATYLRVALEDAGYRVVSATDPGEAMALLVASKPDLICLDLLMPEQTGLSLYADLVRHETLGQVPVVILSGLTNSQGLSAMLDQAGGLPRPSAFLDKPVDVERLLGTVKRLVRDSARVRP